MKHSFIPLQIPWLKFWQSQCLHSPHMDVSPSAASQLCNSAYIYPPVKPAQCFDRLPNLFSYGFIPRKLLLTCYGEMGHTVEGVIMLNVLRCMLLYFGHFLGEWLYQTDSPHSMYVWQRLHLSHDSHVFIWMFYIIMCPCVVFRQGIMPESQRV